MSADVFVRPALPSDVEAIASFTRDTFEWGDYIPDVIESWRAKDDRVVMVAVDDGEPVATGTARILSPTEAWFLGARVHPDYRGRGIAADVSRALREWAAARGANVGRLLVEEENVASIRHVEKTGRRRVATMIHCTKPVGDASPSPDGNGGRPVSSKLRARPASSAEARPALASWTVGELGRASRGLFGIGWAFRRLTVDDLEAAARGSAFWEIGAGWALGSAGPESRFDVGWIETRPEDVTDLLRSLVDLAIGTGSELITLWIPDVDWAVRAARRLGFDTAAMYIYASPL
jgi:GNAT superfamily N-acetyltransferase